MSASSRVPVPPGPSWLTAPTPSTAARRSLPRGRPVTAPMSATGTLITSGLAATPGETTRSTRTGRHSSSKPPCGSSCCSASLRPATLTGPPRPSKGCKCATQVATRAHGVRRRQAASWMPGNGTTALRGVRMPDELEQIAGAARLGRRGRAGRGLPRPEPNGLALGDLPGVEQVELDFPDDAGDAGLAWFPGGEVAGFP